MDKFQQFVNQIPGHIRWVIILKGGNNYKEGTSPPDELWEAFLRERQAEIDRGSLGKNCAVKKLRSRKSAVHLLS
jgi:hypothetical protein